MNDENKQRKIYKISELTKFIKRLLESNIGSVWIEGELSNVRQPSSGHYYLTIKDSSSQISAVLFKGNQTGLKFRLKDGIKIRCYGQITVYEPGGNYQIILRKVEEVGKGSLHEQFEALKEKLRQEGLFDNSRKKNIPILPRHIGIVTSDTGAAIRDILNVINRRFPNIHILLAPARVQGEQAAKEIAEAIDLLNQTKTPDVIIVGRGGGSFEDLFCFNEEVVARAIVRSKIPVVSAVGHEIDYTISDFVADLRAPTPSAAAELVVDRKDEFVNQLNTLEQKLKKNLLNSLENAKSKISIMANNYAFREPQNIIRKYRQQLDTAVMKMEHNLKSELNKTKDNISTFSIKINHSMSSDLQKEKYKLKDYDSRLINILQHKQQVSWHLLNNFSGQLKALNPLAVLQRGYSVVRNSSGEIIKLVGDVTDGEILTTLVSDGSITSTVKNKKKSQ